MTILLYIHTAFGPMAWLIERMQNLCHNSPELEQTTFALSQLLLYTTKNLLTQFNRNDKHIDDISTHVPRQFKAIFNANLKWIGLLEHTQALCITVDIQVYISFTLRVWLVKWVNWTISIAVVASMDCRVLIRMRVLFAQLSVVHALFDVCDTLGHRCVTWAAFIYLPQPTV